MQAISAALTDGHLCRRGRTFERSNGHCLPFLRRRLCNIRPQGRPGETGIRNVQFRPFQPRELLSQLLGIADVHCLSLKAELDGLLLPSKFYGIAAAGRPMIVVGSRESELAGLAVEYDCGFNVPPGNGAAFVRAVLALYEDPVRKHRMGLNARRMLDERFARATALERWQQVLQNPRSRAETVAEHNPEV